MTAVEALLLTPGASGAADHRTLVDIETALTGRIRVRRHDFAYRRAGRRAPPRAPSVAAELAGDLPRLAAELGVSPDHLAIGGGSARSEAIIKDRTLVRRAISTVATAAMLGALRESVPAAAAVFFTWPLAARCTRSQLPAAARSIDGSTTTAHSNACNGSANAAAILTLRDFVRQAINKVSAAASDAISHDTAGCGGTGSSQSPTSTTPTNSVAATTTTTLDVNQTIHASRIACALVDSLVGGSTGLGRDRLRDLIGLPTARWPTREIAPPVTAAVALEIP